MRYSAYKHSENPLFTKEEAEYWDSLPLPEDEQYYMILGMTKYTSKEKLYKVLGHELYCSFMLRMQEDDKEEYDSYTFVDPFKLPF